MTERMPARRALEGEVIGGTLYPYAGGAQPPVPEVDAPDLDAVAAEAVRRNRRRDLLNVANIALCVGVIVFLVCLVIRYS